MAGQTGPKFKGEIEKEAVLAKVAQMERRGCLQSVIAREIGVTQPQVSIYIRQIKQRYRKSQMEDVQALIEDRLEQIREVKWEAWQAWERSKQDAQRVKTEQRATPFGITNIESDERTGQAGDGRYLKLILECIKEEISLTGIEPPKKVDMNAKVQTLSWDALSKEVTGNNGYIRNEVEDQIAQALGLTPERVQLGHVEAKNIQESAIIEEESREDTGSNGVNGHSISEE